MLGTLSGALQAQLPQVAQRLICAKMAENVLAQNSKFSEMRALLKAIPIEHTKAVVREAFGDFGAELLALDITSPLVFGDSVLSYDVGEDGELFVLRRAKRGCVLRVQHVHDLVIERSFNGGPFETLHVLQVVHRANNCCARLSAFKQGGKYLFRAVVGGWRYRVDRNGNVFKSSVVPKNQHLRLPRRLDSFLHEAAQQNQGSNLMLKTMPEGDRAQPYQMVARNTVLHRQVNIFVEPWETRVRPGRQHIFYPYYRIDPVDNTIITLEVFRGQALFRPEHLRLHEIPRTRLDNKWRLHKSARLGNHLFFCFRRHREGKVEGVVRLPNSIFCIRELLLTDENHLMYLCCHDQRHVPTRVEDEYGGNPLQKSCLPLTVIAPITRCDVGGVFSKLRQMFIDDPEMTHDEKLEAIHEAAPCAMHPRLAIPGFFSSQARFGDKVATQFSGALLIGNGISPSP